MQQEREYRTYLNAEMVRDGARVAQGERKDRFDGLDAHGKRRVAWSGMRRTGGIECGDRILVRARLKRHGTRRVATAWEVGQRENGRGKGGRGVMLRHDVGPAGNYPSRRARPTLRVHWEKGSPAASTLTQRTDATPAHTGRVFPRASTWTARRRRVVRHLVNSFSPPPRVGTRA